MTGSMSENIIEERFELAKERISEIVLEETVGDAYRVYFCEVGKYVLQLAKTFEEIKKGDYFDTTLEDLAQKNQALYGPVLEGNYQDSFGNPDYAVGQVGEEYGRILSAVYAQIIDLVVPTFEQNQFLLTIHMELLLELYGLFATSYQELGKAPRAELVREILYFFVHDYLEDVTEIKVCQKIDPQQDFAKKIVLESDLSDLRYLYRFGVYIGKNQIESAKYFNALPEETLRLMADTYTEGYRIGFVKGNKDLSKKKVAQIVYPIGFERMIKKAIGNLKEIGLDVTMMMDSNSFFGRRSMSAGGCYGQTANKQFVFDHLEDEALFLDGKMTNRRLEVQKEAYEAHKELAYVHAGPAVVEVFGEALFAPEIKANATKLNEKQQAMSAKYYGQLGQLVNQYIKGEERSFTIIAFPVPEIGTQYEEIMRDTIALNTLDYKTYENVQQVLIDALDLAEYVKVHGCNGNRTELTVSLANLQNPSKQTKFENCVADVNIPVGEVFTSPVLKGTNGVLHVSKVFLNELEYRDLELTFQDGRVVDYRCANYEDEKEGRKFIKDNVLHHHDSLPIGEFAIGTNTTAYVMGRKYGIEDKLPILIAEKTGPHFAVGDTCYSHAEDVAVYNEDGKEIIARDNEVSLLRKEDAQKAYFQCHTDITIPYDELGGIVGVTKDGEEIWIIKEGRFVLPGSELLNDAFRA